MYTVYLIFEQNYFYLAAPVSIGESSCKFRPQIPCSVLRGLPLKVVLLTSLFSLYPSLYFLFNLKHAHDINKWKTT